MIINILNQIKNADLHSARSNAIKIGDERLISLIERLMHCDVEEYEHHYHMTLAHLTFINESI